MIYIGTVRMSTISMDIHYFYDIDDIMIYRTRHYIGWGKGDNLEASVCEKYQYKIGKRDITHVYDRKHVDITNLKIRQVKNKSDIYEIIDDMFLDKIIDDLLTNIR